MRAPSAISAVVLRLNLTPRFVRRNSDKSAIPDSKDHHVSGLSQKTDVNTVQADGGQAPTGCYQTRCRPFLFPIVDIFFGLLTRPVAPPEEERHM